jgi:hypothetical protein
MFDEGLDGAEGPKCAGHSDLHRTPRQVHDGGLMLSVRRFNSSESSGSATNLISVALHFAHSKVRFSERSAPGATSASRIRVRHLAQCGHSMGKRAANIG